MTNVAAVSDALPQSSATDEIAWAQLEVASETVERNGMWAWKEYRSTYVDRAPKCAAKAHPDSYCADLPLRSELGKRRTKKWTLTAAEKKSLAARPLVFGSLSTLEG